MHILTLLCFSIFNFFSNSFNTFTFGKFLVFHERELGLIAVNFNGYGVGCICEGVGYRLFIIRINAFSELVARKLPFEFREECGIEKVANVAV